MDITDKEIVEYYGQIWGNVKHMKSYVKELRDRYKKELAFQGMIDDFRGV